MTTFKSTEKQISDLQLNITFEQNVLYEKVIQEKNKNKYHYKINPSLYAEV